MPELQTLLLMGLLLVALVGVVYLSHRVDVTECCVRDLTAERHGWKAHADHEAQTAKRNWDDLQTARRETATALASLRATAAELDALRQATARRAQHARRRRIVRPRRGKA